MRTLSFITLFLIVVLNAAYAQTSDGYEIKVKIEGLQQDSVAYLGYHFGEKRYYQDTSTIGANGETFFAGDQRLKKGVYFLYSKSYYLEFIVNEQRFSIETTREDGYQNMEIRNSPENEAFREFQLVMKGHQAKIQDLNQQLKDATTKKDSSEIYVQAGKLAGINESKRDSLKSLYSDRYVAVLLRLMEKTPQETGDGTESIEQKRKWYNEYKSQFLDGIDFNDEGTLRAPVFHGKVMEFMEKVTFQHPDSVVASADCVLKKSKDNEEMFRYWVVYFFQHYQKSKIMGLDKVFVHIAENYYLKGKTPWADKDMLTKLEEEMDFHRENQMGMQAPLMHLVDTLLDRVSLRSIPAEYMVLFFYSPDCGHCKKSTPALLDAYHGLQSEGVEVMAVNVDTDIDKWKAFVQEQQLDWINLADPFTRSNFRRQYNVRSTPTIYILDREKTIIAKKLGVEQIEGFIKDRIRFDNRDKL